jgi:hypothetical protein
MIDRPRTGAGGVCGFPVGRRAGWGRKRWLERVTLLAAVPLRGTFRVAA